MIEKLLNKIGFYKANSVRDLEKNPLTLDELSYLYSKAIGENDDFLLDEKTEKKIFDEMSNIEGIQNFWRSMAAKDIRRHFMAINDEQRAIIKGGFGRTVYLSTKLNKKQKQVDTKLSNLRYE